MRAALVFLPLMFHACSQPAKGQQNAFAGTVDVGPSSNSAFVADSGANEIVSRLLAENERRKERLQGYTVIRTYEIKSREGKMAAQSVVRMEYRAPDAKTFEKTSEQGSAIVRRLVFDELMDSESQSSSGKQREDSALTPVNYVFHFAGEEDLGPYHCLVLRVVPRRVDKFLFEGRIWVESNDFAVAKIEGHPAKKLSFWIKQADFVREYQRVDGFWLPLRDETQVDVKVYGRRVLTIEHGPYRITNNSEP
jgi:hypothetical protein